MKLIYLTTLAIFIAVSNLVGQPSYFWSLDKRISIEKDYTTVTLRLNKDLNLREVASQLEINENQILRLTKVNQKLARIDLRNAVSISSILKEKPSVVIPSLILDREYSMPVLMTGEITVLPNAKLI